MESYTIAKISKLNGNNLLAGKYVLYCNNTISSNILNYEIEAKAIDIVKKYLSIVKKDGDITLSTKLREQYITSSLPGRKTVTLKLEELIETEKEAIEKEIVRCEQ